MIRPPIVHAFADQVSVVRGPSSEFVVLVLNTQYFTEERVGPIASIGSVPGPEVIKLFSCSTQLSAKFQLLIKAKYRQMKKFLALSLPDVVFIMLINVKMPTIVGILTFMSRINFMLS